MDKFNINEWVEGDPEHKFFRQAVHTILTAISGTPELQTNMVMKGGILLALGYESTRYTKDIDFSTSTKTKDFNADTFVEHFNKALIKTVENLDYGLGCQVQSWKQEPPGDDKTFPTIQIKVGYADRGDSRASKRLQLKKSPNVIRVDYSLNEPESEIELFEIDGGKSIRTYSFHDLLGEKFRALLQQEVRKRIRPQDIYDLFFLLNDHPDGNDPLVKLKILKSLETKAAARNLTVDKDSMGNPEIISRSKAQYQQLSVQVEGELPPFDDVYENVRSYYQSLPWNE